MVKSWGKGVHFRGDEVQANSSLREKESSDAGQKKKREGGTPVLHSGCGKNTVFPSREEEGGGEKGGDLDMKGGSRVSTSSTPFSAKNKTRVSSNEPLDERTYSIRAGRTEKNRPSTTRLRSLLTSGATHKKEGTKTAGGLRSEGGRARTQQTSLVGKQRTVFNLYYRAEGGKG